MFMAKNFHGNQPACAHAGGIPQTAVGGPQIGTRDRIFDRLLLTAHRRIRRSDDRPSPNKA
jgi:hypothetical protein